MSETLQFFIVLPIILLAGWFVFRRFKNSGSEDGDDCHTCSGCPMQNQCGEPEDKP